MFHTLIGRSLFGRAARWLGRPRQRSVIRHLTRKPILERLEERTLPDAGLPHLLTLPKEGFVKDLYGSLLHRGPTSVEASKLTRALDSGLARTDVIAKVVASREYLKQPGAWLSHLYDDVLGRLPDARSLAAWSQAFRDGLSREMIARGILYGKEFQRHVGTAQAEAAALQDSGVSALVTPHLPSGLLVQSGNRHALSRLTTLVRAKGATVEPTDIPGLFRVNGNDIILPRLARSLRKKSFVKYAEIESTYQLNAAPNDPRLGDGTLWGLTGAYGIGATSAWNTTTGSTKVVVAVVDTGVDYNHIDLFKNIWINQGEIPASWYTRSSAYAGYDTLVFRSSVTDVDADGKTTFWDLNDTANAGRVWDNNGDGRISGSDILRPRGQGGWEDGADTSGNGYVDDLVGWNFVANNNRPFDDQGHGTHVSGTIGAMGNNGLGVVGVNWKTQIMALKFLDAGGTGSNADAAAALRFGADNGARVSNNSWGGPANDSTVRNAIIYAGNKGQIVVAAAGNDGRNISTYPTYPAAYHLSNMIVVAATDSNGYLASFSNYSATLVDVAAPGKDIYSTMPGGGYGYLSGTSMATPHVSGLLALVQAAQPNLTMSQVIGRVLNNTTRLTSLTSWTVTGGLINAARAVGATTTPGVPQTPNTPAWTPDAGGYGWLSWNTVTGASSYVVQYSGNGQDWFYQDTISAPSVYVPGGYYYRVAAGNASGSSNFSGAVYAGQQTGQPPATPSNPTWSSAGGTSIVLYWNAVSGATQYSVQYWSSPSSSWVTLGTYSGTSLQITAGLGLYWRLAAANAYGMSSYSSHVLAGQAPTAPSWSWAGGSNVYLYWNTIGASSYVVQYWNSTNSAWITLGTYGSSVTSVQILNGYGYHWRVGAVYSGSSPLFSDYTQAQ